MNAHREAAVAQRAQEHDQHHAACHEECFLEAFHYLSTSIQNITPHPTISASMYIPSTKIVPVGGGMFSSENSSREVSTPMRSLIAHSRAWWQLPSRGCGVPQT